MTTPPPAGNVQALPKAALAADTNATNKKARHNGRAFFGVLLHTMGKMYANARHGVNIYKSSGTVAPCMKPYMSSTPSSRFEARTLFVIP